MFMKGNCFQIGPKARIFENRFTFTVFVNSLPKSCRANYLIRILLSFMICAEVNNDLYLRRSTVNQSVREAGRHVPRMFISCSTWFSMYITFNLFVGFVNYSKFCSTQTGFQRQIRTRYSILRIISKHNYIVNMCRVRVTLCAFRKSHHTLEKENLQPDPLGNCTIKLTFLFSS